MKRLLLAVCVLAAAAGCAQMQPPLTLNTFNAKALFADSFATATGQTCVDLSKRERISVELLTRCRNVVREAGVLIDASRVTQDIDKLAAAHELLLKLEADLKAAEEAK